jgi:hypothetical protein
MIHDNLKPKLSVLFRIRASATLAGLVKAASSTLVIVGCLWSFPSMAHDENCAGEQLGRGPVVAIYFDSSGNPVVVEDLSGVKERCYRKLEEEENNECPPGTCAFPYQGRTYCYKC